MVGSALHGVNSWWPLRVMDANRQIPSLSSGRRLFQTGKLITYRIDQNGPKFQGVETSHDGSVYVVDGFTTKAAAQSWLDENPRMLSQGEADPWVD